MPASKHAGRRIVKLLMLGKSASPQATAWTSRHPLIADIEAGDFAKATAGRHPSVPAAKTPRGFSCSARGSTATNAAAWRVGNDLAGASLPITSSRGLRSRFALARYQTFFLTDPAAVAPVLCVCKTQAHGAVSDRSGKP